MKTTGLKYFTGVVSKHDDAILSITDDGLTVTDEGHFVYKVQANNKTEAAVKILALHRDRKNAAKDAAAKHRADYRSRAAKRLEKMKGRPRLVTFMANPEPKSGPSRKELLALVAFAKEVLVAYDRSPKGFRKWLVQEINGRCFDLGLTPLRPRVAEAAE